MKNPSPDRNQDPATPDEASRQPKCEDVQGLLFDYLGYELGDARSRLVREHLRHCEACRGAAAELQGTLELLRRVSEKEREVALRLSARRRARLRWAFAHPLLDWIFLRHAIISFIVTFFVLALVLFAARKLHILSRDEGEGIRITLLPTATQETPPRDSPPPPPPPPAP
jgi:predicted anti-sigma-YlaC factor YlaD